MSIRNSFNNLLFLIKKFFIHYFQVVVCPLCALLVRIFCGDLSFHYFSKNLCDEKYQTIIEKFVFSYPMLLRENSS